MIFQFAAQIWKMNHQVDVVHANWLLAGCAAYLARILGGRPYIVTCRGEDLKLLELPVVSIFLKIILRKATFVTTVSLQFRDQILRHIPDRAGQVVCIPNGVTGPSEDEVAPLSQRPKTLLYVGRVIPLKRLEWAVNLLSSPELEDYELIVCGRAEDEAYRQKLVSEAQDRGVAGRIRFAGVVPPSEIGRYLERARYFINFSEYEGRPNSVLEALAYGLVVLASDITAHREVLENGRNGMLCTSPEEGAAVIQQLDRDPELYDRISHEARRSVQPYTWEAAADAYSQIFARATISS
jgi:glycosyltransferase involved in cell wall biosynthesis